MSEAVNEIQENQNVKELRKPSFEERVWRTLSNIDVDQYTRKKQRFDYLPWADCWMLLMTHFPQSEFSFDDPVMLEEGAGGEQWVTVTIRDGEESMSRRWWLPFLDHMNKPISRPTSLQINNTRMRALVKCIAMCGLGVEVYSGEDVPDKGLDEQPVSSVRRTSARAELIEEMGLTDEDWARVDEWVEKFREAMPAKDVIDWDALVPIYKDVAKLGDLAIPISDKLESWQRTALKKVRDRLAEQA